jgi:NAD(P)-dependent dehydrogenase (short-subunit alcohol dehydrogenase family)
MDINLTSVIYSSALAFHYLPLVKKALLPLPNPLSLRSAAAEPAPPALKALVLTGSMASLFGTSPEDVEYSASKAGVLGILHGLRERCDDGDIRLGMVAPYFVQTPLLPEGFEPPLGTPFSVLSATHTQLTVVHDSSRSPPIARLDQARGRPLCVPSCPNIRSMGVARAELHDRHQRLRRRLLTRRQPDRRRAR